MSINVAMSAKVIPSIGEADRPVGDDAAVVLWQWDPASDRLYINGDTTSPMLAGLEAMTTGQSFLRCIRPTDFRRHTQRMQQLLAGTRRSFRCISQIHTKLGLATLRLEALPLRSGDGRILQIYGSATLRAEKQSDDRHSANPAGTGNIDSSCLKRSWLAGISALEASEFSEAKLRREEELSKSQSMLLAHVTHELKNAINAVGGYGDMIEADAIATDQPKIARWAASIAQARDHAKDLIDNVLDACRIEAGQSPVEIDSFELMPTLLEVTAIAQPLADRRANQIQLEASSAPVSMNSDQLKLRQILINLLSNAAKFTTNGRIALTVRGESNGQVAFEIADTGVGMTASQLERLFQPFSQVGDKIDRRGTGLGLHITRNLCRLLGGKITVDSVPGQGSQFRVVLPVDMAHDFSPVTDGPRSELVIGMVEGLTSLDPHGPPLRSSQIALNHVFEALTEFGDSQHIVPCLATRWFAVDSRTWLFELRSGVRFHDGSEFSGEDVIATFQRLKRLNSQDPSIGAMVSEFSEYRLISPCKLLIRTKRPWPTLPAEMTELFIVNRRFAEADSSAFDSVAAVIGTGPFRLVSGALDTQLRCEAFDGHWRGQPGWKSLMIRFVPDEVDLIKALAAGEIDVVDDFHPRGQIRIQDLPDLRITSCDASGFYNLGIVSSPASNPRVTDRSGKPLPVSPLHDARVRKAMSYSIDREFLCKHVMLGFAKPAGDMVPSCLDGANPANRPDSYDPGAARQLLAQAGYPEGFNLVLTTPDDMAYLPLVRAISVMLSSVGIETRYEALDTRTFYAALFRGEFAVGLTIWHDPTGEATYTLKALLGTANAEDGIGSANNSAYSNSEFDRALQNALMAGDRDERIRHLQEACAIGASDMPIIPLVEPSACWVVRNGYRVRSNRTGMTWARLIDREPEQTT